MNNYQDHPLAGAVDLDSAFNKLWSFVEDIAPRNPAPSGKEKKSRKPVSYDLFPPQ